MPDLLTDNVAKLDVLRIADRFGDGAPLLYRVLRERGEEFRYEVPNPQVLTRLNRLVKPQPRACYRNAQNAALLVKELDYYEGFYCSEELPFTCHHAWVTLRGRVIDLTLQCSFTLEYRKQFHYFGIHIPTPEINRHHLDQRRYEPLTEGRTLLMMDWYNERVAKEGTVNLKDLKVGDRVTRMLVPMDLIVTELTKDTITAGGGWQFDRRYGAEIDEYLRWGPPPLMTGSYIETDDTRLAAIPRETCCGAVKGLHLQTCTRKR